MNLISGNKYLFDTTVYIDLFHGRPIGKKLHYQARFMETSVGYSIITEAELWVGIRGFHTEAEHIEVLKPYKRYFVNVTIARNAGQYLREFMQEGLPPKDRPGLPDCMIAATAKFYGLRLVTKNTRHMPKFTRYGVIVDEYSDNDA